MTDAFRKVKSGDPLVISAAAYNAMLDAAIANMRSSSKPSQVRGEQGLHVLVRNETGYPLEQFEVLGIEGPAFHPRNQPDAFQQTPVLRGVVPKDQHKGKFVVVQEPAAPGCVVRACVSGMTVARVYVENASSQPKACDIEEGYTYDLTAGSTGGASILWIEGGTGPKWALIRIGHGDVATLFPVVLKKSSGEDGDEKTATTWRYDVSHALTEESLVKDIDPTAKPHQWRRPAIGKMTQATFGYAHYDKDEKLVVGWINETFVLSSCVEEDEDA